MEQLLNVFGAWTWWIIGVVLLIGELALPGVFLVWLGVAALLVGTVDLAVALPWQAEIVLFAALSVILVMVGQPILNRRLARESDLPNLNRRGHANVGRVCVVADAIRNGEGKVRLDDTLWLATGPDLDAGTVVRVTGVDGTMLVVAPEGASVPPRH